MRKTGEMKKLDKLFNSCEVLGKERKSSSFSWCNLFSIAEKNYILMESSLMLGHVDLHLSNLMI